MTGDHHRITVVIDTDENKRINEITRLVIGLQGIAAPDVEIDYAVDLSEVLIAREEQADQAKDDEPF